MKRKLFASLLFTVVGLLAINFLFPTNVKMINNQSTAIENVFKDPPRPIENKEITKQIETRDMPEPIVLGMNQLAEYILKPDIKAKETLIQEVMNQNKYGPVTIVTIAHIGYLLQVQSWILNLQRSGYNKFVVFCYDKQLLDHLESLGYAKNSVLVPNEWLDFILTSNKTQSNETIFVQLIKSKINVWYQLSCLEQSFVYSDPDVVWLSSSTLAHLDHAYEHCYAEILFSQNQGNRAIVYNTGFFYARATPFVKDLFYRAMNELKANVNNLDQNAVNNVLRESYSNDSRVDTLDIVLYANGIVRFGYKANQRMSIEPLIFQYKYNSNEATKRVEEEAQKAQQSKHLDGIEEQFKIKHGDNSETKIQKLMIGNKIDNITIITIGNYGFREFILNWILSLKKYNYNRFVVFSYDQALVDHLSEKGYQNNVILVPTDWLDYNLSANFTSWGEGEYKLIVKSKTNIWNCLLTRNYSFLFSDPDVAWLSAHILDHLKFQYDHSRAEVLFSRDVMGRVPYCNTGFFYAIATPFVKALFGTILKMQRSAEHNESVEQYILRDLMWVTKFNDTRLDTLDLFLYANGAVHFNEKLSQKFKINPLTVHANYLVGREGKMNNFKNYGYWLV